MSYTNAELISSHLASAFPSSEQIANQPLVLNGDDYQRFFNGAVDETSVQVKSLQSNDLTRTVVSLGAGSVTLSSAPIVPGSVVVAADSSLGTVYVENTDYVIDYSAGTIILKSGGALSGEQAVTVWYQSFALYSAGEDYQLQAEKGWLRRLSGGDIASGETVYLDYAPVLDSFNDDVLATAVAEANSLIEHEVDPDGQFGADRTLQAAATYRALAIVCRTSAARELSSGRGEDRTALAWMKLADQYDSSSETLLKAFRPPADGPSAPVHS